MCLFLWQNYCDILGIRHVDYVNSTSAYYYMFCLDSIIILFLVQCFNHSLYIYIYIYVTGPTNLLRSGLEPRSLAWEAGALTRRLKAAATSVSC